MECPKCGKEMKEATGKVPSLLLPYFKHKKSHNPKSKLRNYQHCDNCNSDYVISFALIEINREDNTRIRAW